MKNILKYYVSIFLLILLHLPSSAQTKNVAGSVRDAVDNSPMSAVSVLKKSKGKAPQGVLTDDNGEFTISASAGDTLEFSFIGKKTIKEIVGQRNILEVLMYNDESQLDEVVVTAFGTAKKSSVASSIESVRVSKLQIPASNLTTAFAGRIAGVVSFQTSGEPGADNAQFFIRGVGSFGYKSEPLYLIDGFESTKDDLARLRPDDIESFSVMKDAAATVMYGARSANGIISVTTKSGFEGPARVSARFDVNVAMPTRNVEFLDGVDYMRLYNEAQQTRKPELDAFYDEQKIQSTARGDFPMIFPNVDWYNILFNKQTINQRANLNVSGGGQVATYFVAGGFDHETGLLKVDKRNNFNNNIDIKRFFIRSNVIFKLSKTTTLDTRITGRFERYVGPYETAQNIFNQVMWSNPVDFPPVYAPDEANMDTEHILFGSTTGTFDGGGFKVNPYANMVKGYEDRNENSITAQATLLQDLSFITEGLRASFKASVNSWGKYSSRRSYSPYYYALESFDHITGDYTLFALNPTGGQAYLGEVEPGRDASGQYYYEAILNWNRKFGRNSLAFTGVGIAQENLITGGNSRSLFETLPEKNMGISGKLSYDFDSRYFLEFIYGFNGSEKFTGSKQYGFFPAFAGAWLVSNESFFKPFQPFISSFKLKGSWGRGGNDAISNRSGRFFFLSDVSIPGNFNASDNSYRWGGTFMNAYNGYDIIRYANPDITWEVSTQYNVGFELGLFKREALKLQVEYFKEDRSKIYMERQNFPKSAGLEAAISGNVGRMEKHGIDASLNLNLFISDKAWIQGMANFTYYTNRYLEMDEKNYPDEYLKRVGHSISQEWGLIAERLFVDQAEIDNSPRQDFGEYMAGDIKYKDVNGDGVVNKNDRVAMGYPTSAEIQYGFGLSAGYKRFDLSFFFQGNARGSFFINSDAGGGSEGNEGIAPFVNQRNALPIIAKNYWSETNPNPHAFWPRLSTTAISNNTQQSSWWLRDASFIRLKTVEVGYNIPGWSKINLNVCRIYISAENLLTFSGFKLWDPEMGRKGLGYPPNKRFNVGIKLDF